MELSGSCHCDNVTYALQWPEESREIPARRCDCTFCVKHGGVWTSHPAAALRVRVADPPALSRYEFGTRTASFLVCARCGAAPLVTCEADGRTYAVVNVNTLDGVDPGMIRVAPASFEGEDKSSRLARRRRNWIANVSMEEGPP